MRKNIYSAILLLLLSGYMLGQESSKRIQKLDATLDSLTVKIPELSKTVDYSINSVELSTFLRSIASSNNLNLSLEPSLNTIVVSQSFSNATVKNVLLNLCREYSLTIEPLGNILSVKRYKAPYVAKDIPVFYNKKRNLFTADIQNDSLSAAFRKIITVTGKNLVFSVGMGNKKISAFIKDMPFDAAIDKIALANQLQVTKTKDNFYVFENQVKGTNNYIGSGNRARNFYFQIKDSVKGILEVDFVDTPVEAIINDIAYGLKLNIATSKPLNNIGKATIKADTISFNKLLDKILEDTRFSYKLENGMYFFGEKKLESVKNTEIIPLMSRSIQLMMEPMQSSGEDDFNQSRGDNYNGNRDFGNQLNQNRNLTNGITNRNSNRRPIETSQREPFSSEYGSKGEALLSLVPKQITDSLSISTDVEQNSFIVSGDAQKIEKFRNFLKKIDKPVPVVLIEVMIIEVNKSATVSAGIDLGIGDAPTTDKGTLFSGTDLTLGAKSINKIIGGFNGFGSLNVGKVGANFYARIQALETNGDLKIKSTPKLSTLNGHVATLSNGERSYYAVRENTTIGSQNPSVIQSVYYEPTDANLSIKIRPLVSGDGNITLSINVIQSDFNGERIADDAPPGINSRKFTSTIRVKDQDVIVLGGLEENVKSNSGSGVPFLARIPIIKWLFSKRTRTASNSKLSILIKPTIIQ